MEIYEKLKFKREWNIFSDKRIKDVFHRWRTSLSVVHGNCHCYKSLYIWSIRNCPPKHKTELWASFWHPSLFWQSSCSFFSLITTLKESSFRGEEWGWEYFSRYTWNRYFFLTFKFNEHKHTYQCKWAFAFILKLLRQTVFIIHLFIQQTFNEDWGCAGNKTKSLLSVKLQSCWLDVGVNSPIGMTISQCNTINTHN